MLLANLNRMKRYFRPTIDLIAWLSVATALLANIIAAARGEAALKKAKLEACPRRLVLRQRAVAYATICTNHAQLWIG